MKEYPSVAYFLRVFVISIVIGPIAFLLITLISAAWQSEGFSSVADAPTIWLIFIFGTMLGFPGAIIFGIAAKYLSKTKVKWWIKKLLLITLAIFLVFLSNLIFIGVPFRGLMDGNIFVSYCIAVTAAILLVKLRAPEPVGLAD